MSLKTWPLLFVLFLSACTHKDKPQDTTTPLDKVKVKRASYLGWSMAHQDKEGFLIDATCDSLLFSCLYKVGGGKVNYISAEDPNLPGSWYRDSGRTCTVGHGTANRISRDMLLGLAYCVWQTADKANAKAVLAYADSHGGIMGEGDPAVTSIQPFLYHLFQAIVAHLDRAQMPSRPDPNVEPPKDPKKQQFTESFLKGYVAHLTMIGILLDGLIYNGLTSLELAVVKDQAARQPRNALYQAIMHKYTDGDQSAAVAVLLDDSIFPVDHLPTSAQRDTYYLWQRDQETENWAPSPHVKDPGFKPEEFSGSDLIFATAVIAEELRGDKHFAP